MHSDKDEHGESAEVVEPSVDSAAIAVSDPRKQNLAQAKRLFDDGFNVAAIEEATGIPARTIFHISREQNWSRGGPISNELVLKLTKLHEDKMHPLAVGHYEAIDELLRRVKQDSGKEAEATAKAVKTLTESLRVFQPVMQAENKMTETATADFSGLMPDKAALAEVAERTENDEAESEVQDELTGGSVQRLPASQRSTPGFSPRPSEVQGTGGSPGLCEELDGSRGVSSAESGT